MARQGTNISCITGEVFVKQDSARKRVVKFLKLNGHSEIETGANSYAILSDNPSPESSKQKSGTIIFPNTRISVLVKRGYIEEVEILKGLVNVYVASGKRVLTPVAEFNGGAWVDVASDGRTMVANTRDTIYNRETRRAVTLDVNQQALVTKENVGKPEPMDQRFYQAQKTLEELGAFGGAEMYQQMADGSEELLSATLEVQKHVAKMTGQDLEKLKEETEQEHQKYRQWAQSEAEKLHQDQKKIREKDFDHVASMIPVDQTMKYQGIELNILEVKREPKQEGTDLLSLCVEAKNDSPNQVFIFWNEESRLINEKGESFPVDDYDLETSFETGAKAKGYLFIPVSSLDQRFVFQLGKKSLPKVEIDLDLAEASKGGD